MGHMLDDALYESLRDCVLKNRDMFSMEKLVADYMDIYQRVLSGVRRAGSV
jgi:hypothetical protein